MTSRQAIDQTSSITTLDAASNELNGLAPSTTTGQDDRPLREAVFSAMRRYFDHLDGGTVTDLHAMVMAEVEAPLLSSVLEYTHGNQTRAAEMLGLNRGTLRKKLKHYNLI
ncbi:DNA-binding transcriptional regulator Fis [Halomonas binhaiensis]|uniref:Putative Fis-like DNA-binding protein n=1 Tax=Halomonas binhaiensis TaxID=2562282 RepID=A0A5C1NE13_9GAMM|nr:DNA-binding transcriptional regulator Fis [Halomonas binhaiensis]QEM81474.1 DNA-binding transcriptional regulator Fis [Halomonas binhaiensis]